jgi:hypothetical protein
MSSHKGYKEFDRKGENGEGRKKQGRTHIFHPFFAFCALVVSFLISGFSLSTTSP